MKLELYVYVFIESYCTSKSYYLPEAKARCSHDELSSNEQNRRRDAHIISICKSAHSFFIALKIAACG